MIPESGSASNQEAGAGRPPPASANKRASDHLANERTFLAWIRTGLATITFGFVVARFGLLLRELGVHTRSAVPLPEHFSSLIGTALVLLGVGVIAVALGNFVHVRRALDTGQFRPMTIYACLLTIFAGAIGLLLAMYLFLTIY